LIVLVLCPCYLCYRAIESRGLIAGFIKVFSDEKGILDNVIVV
jgi:hypothetical protein